nr:unnamed protein product [Callosobruchus analis]
MATSLIIPSTTLMLLHVIFQLAAYNAAPAIKYTAPAIKYAAQHSSMQLHWSNTQHHQIMSH